MFDSYWGWWDTKIQELSTNCVLSLHSTFMSVLVHFTGVSTLCQQNCACSDADLKWSHFFLQFGIYAEGLESLVGEGEETEEESSSASADSESAPEVEPTAGMTFTLMDVLLRQIEFFRGSAGLMSAAWNAPSELTSALQVKREFLKFNILIIYPWFKAGWLFQNDTCFIVPLLFSQIWHSWTFGCLQLFSCRCV